MQCAPSEKPSLFFVHEYLFVVIRRQVREEYKRRPEVVGVAEGRFQLVVFEVLVNRILIGWIPVSGCFVLTASMKKCTSPSTGVQNYFAALPERNAVIPETAGQHTSSRRRRRVRQRGRARCRALGQLHPPSVEMSVNVRKKLIITL